MVAGTTGEKAMDEYRAAPPELEEVMRELDPDTKHIGRPTRSPRRRTEWTVDPYHFPSHARRVYYGGARVIVCVACRSVFTPCMRAAQTNLESPGRTVCHVQRHAMFYEFLLSINKALHEIDDN